MSGLDLDLDSKSWKDSPFILTKLGYKNMRAINTMAKSVDFPRRFPCLTEHATFVMDTNKMLPSLFQKRLPVFFRKIFFPIVLFVRRDSMTTTQDHTFYLEQLATSVTVRSIISCIITPHFFYHSFHSFSFYYFIDFFP